MRSSPAPASSVSTHRAFTLLELLVVLTIIAVLSTLVLVAVGTLKNTARNLQCTTNVRNLAVAMQSYAGDHHGMLPYRVINAEWWIMSLDYLEEQYQDTYRRRRHDVFHCPFADLEIPNPWTTTARFTDHYGMNAHIRVAWTGTQWMYNQPPIHLAQLPANLLLMTDNKAWTVAGLYTYFEGAVYDSTSSGPWPVFLQSAGPMAVAPIRRHGGAVNFVCIDGHTERVRTTWDAAAMALRFKSSPTMTSL